MPVRTHLINRNNITVVTELLDRNVERLGFVGGVGHCLDCIMPNGGPPGDETQIDIDCGAAPQCRLNTAESDRTDAFPIGDLADPGLNSVPATAAKPMFGICKAGIASAPNMDECFGTISTATQSRNAELRLIRSCGYLLRCARLEPIDMPVVSIPTAADAEDRALDAAARLKRQGADVLVLGCAGMARYRTALRARLGLPGVDPSAVAMAMGIVALQ